MSMNVYRNKSYEIKLEKKTKEKKRRKPNKKGEVKTCNIGWVFVWFVDNAVLTGLRTPRFDCWDRNVDSVLRTVWFGLLICIFRFDGQKLCKDVQWDC